MAPVAALVDERRVAHLSSLELRVAWRHLELRPDAIEGPPVGAIIGEAPGTNTSPKLPMFPIPSTSAGGRLMKYSGMKPGEYLGRLARKNLFTVLLPRWSAPEARARAFEVWWWLNQAQRSGVRRLLLLGNRVAAAFGLEPPLELWSVSTGHVRGISIAAIPHPSGRCRVYNDPAARERAGQFVRWAAGLREAAP